MGITAGMLRKCSYWVVKALNHSRRDGSRQARGILTILVTSQLLMELVMDTEELVSVRPVLPSAPSSSCALTAALRGQGNTEKTQQREACQSTSSAEPFTHVPLHLCSFYFGWSCTGQSPRNPPALQLWLLFLPQQFPTKHRNFHPSAQTPAHFVSQLCPGCFFIYLWMLFDKLKKDCFMNLCFSFPTWIWQSARFGSLNYTLLPQRIYNRDQEAWDPSAAPGNTAWMWIGAKCKAAV